MYSCDILEKWSLKTEETYHNCFVTNFLLPNPSNKERRFEKSVLEVNYQKSYHPQQEPCATGLWLLVQQHSQQKEPCYNFCLLH